MRRFVSIALLLLLVVVFVPAVLGAPSATYRIDHVTEGDTVVLRNGQRVRLVQIDTPEVFLGTECYRRQASATTKRLLPSGSDRQLSLAAAEPRCPQREETRLRGSPLHSTALWRHRLT